MVPVSGRFMRRRADQFGVFIANQNVQPTSMRLRAGSTIPISGAAGSPPRGIYSA
jgi:hypothetical protein